MKYETTTFLLSSSNASQLRANGPCRSARRYGLHRKYMAAKVKVCRLRVYETINEDGKSQRIYGSTCELGCDVADQVVEHIYSTIKAFKVTATRGFV